MEHMEWADTGDEPDLVFSTGLVEVYLNDDGTFWPMYRLNTTANIWWNLDPVASLNEAIDLADTQRTARLQETTTS